MRGSRTWLAQQLRTIVNLACGAALMAPIALQANDYAYFDETAPVASLAEPMTPGASLPPTSSDSALAPDQASELMPAPAPVDGATRSP